MAFAYSISQEQQLLKVISHYLVLARKFLFAVRARSQSLKKLSILSAISRAAAGLAQIFPAFRNRAKQSFSPRAASAIIRQTISWS
jgi:hypothetical protein